MKRLLALIAAAGIAVVGVVVLVVDAPDERSPHQSHPRTVPSPTASRVRQIVDGIRTGTPSSIRDSVAIPIGSELDESGVAELRALRELRIDAASFRRAGQRSGTVRATTRTGDHTRVWTVVLLASGETWRIVATSRGWAG